MDLMYAAGTEDLQVEKHIEVGQATIAEGALGSTAATLKVCPQSHHPVVLESIEDLSPDQQEPKEHLGSHTGPCDQGPEAALDKHCLPRAQQKVQEAREAR
jgi:hypothetical protein